MTVPFVMVTIGGNRKLASIQELQEVVPLLALSAIEDPSGNCRGMANLRGEIVPVFDLAGPNARLSPNRSILVYRIESGLIGLIVDDIEDVIEAPRHQVSTRVIGKGHTASMVRLGEELLPVIRPSERLLEDGHDLG